MLLVLTALAAFAPVSPLLPMTVDVVTPDGAHHLMPISQSSGRLVHVCADRLDGKVIDVSTPTTDLSVKTVTVPVPACAVVVVDHGRAHATFDPADPIDSDGELRLVLSAPETFPTGATSIAVGCGMLTGAAIGGAVIAEAVRSADASPEISDGATNAAIGLWLVSGAAAVGTGVAAAFAYLDAAPRYVE
ncbi:MAG: hypothetical protein Q8O67_21340 [Deltaproteobacteria bacterium]|nr:hypothetical protein [Deltaproteobacteria bacterium]